MITRRSFLALGATAATAAIVAPRFVSAAQIKKIGLQLYTVRDAMQADAKGTLEKVAAIGYKEVEFAGYFNHPAAEVKGWLKTLGLDSPSSHVQLANLRDSWPKTLDDVAAVGHEYVVLAWLAPNERGPLDNYKKLADLLNTSGEMARKHGLRLAYHNHDFEFTPTDGAIPYEVMQDRIDPKVVEFEMDLYWVTKAGRDPLQLFAKYPGRFPLLHVKDMAKTEEKGFAEVGRGSIDFAKIFAKAGEAGAKHYYVEQDICPGSPFDSIKISYDYLKMLKY